MLTIEIENAGTQPALAKGLAKQFDDLIERVQRRAYELFEQRGGEHGSDSEDWFRAEEELLFPVKFEIEQKPGMYKLHISLPGFTAKDLNVYTVDNTVILRGNAPAQSAEGADEAAERTRMIFCRWPLPAGAQADAITAEFRASTLVIKMPIGLEPAKNGIEKAVAR